MYRHFDNISWIGIKYIGNMAEVQLVEGSEAPKKEAEGGPCHVVAGKEGYIEKIIPKEGLAALEKGAYVKPGDIAITGLMPIEDKTYLNREGQTRSVHAEGEVWARILYRFTRYQERYELIKKETGRHFYGFSIQIGDFSWDSGDLFWPYDSAVREEQRLFHFVKPVPVSFSVTRLAEVELFRRERGEEDVKQLAKAQSREAAKENIPENTQILNNSLKFTDKENIIEVTIMLHALEEIGQEQEFVPETPSAEDGGDTGGTASFGEST